MIKDIKHARKYTKDGQEKTAWNKVGKLFKKDDGKMTIKLDALPVGDFDGWLVVTDPYEPDGARPQISGGSEPF